MTHDANSESRGTSPANDTLGIADAAAMMRLGVESLHELIVTGEIPAASLNRKHMVLLRADVLDYLRDLARRQQAERKGRIAAALVPSPVVERRVRGRPRRQLQ
jgi:hypothetical protein